MLNAEPRSRILVVEDGYLLAEQICDTLARNDMVPVGPAPTLLQALSLARFEQIDAAILDVRLASEALVFPVCDVLRARGIPFLFLTGFSDAVAAAGMGAPVIAKPFENADLMAALRLLLASA